MVPVRRLAELMGAVVAQNTTSGQTIVSRAGDTITLTPNSKTAYINGAATTLTVVPFMESNQIYVSVDDLADWFGQTVTRSKDKQLIEITEDKSVAGSSNLEQWAISMGALLLYKNNPKEANLFGGKVRYGAMAVGSAVTDRIHTTGPGLWAARRWRRIGASQTEKDCLLKPKHLSHRIQHGICAA